MSNPTETDHEPATKGRALVVLSGQNDHGREERPSAIFVTQLIASNGRMPAYRRACRTDPGSAVTIYGGERPKPRASLDLAV